MPFLAAVDRLAVEIVPGLMSLDAGPDSFPALVPFHSVSGTGGPYSRGRIGVPIRYIRAMAHEIEVADSLSSSGP